MILPRGLTLCALAVALGVAPCGASLRVGASTTWAENITRASAPGDWRDAAQHEVNGGFGHFRQLTAGLITSGEVVASYEHVPRYTDLDLFTAGVSGQARQKFGLGAFAPVVSIDVDLRGRAARRDGDDGWTASAALRVAKRLTESFRASVVGDWQQHYARSSIFDTRHHRLFGTLAWDITDRLQLSHGNGRLWGDFTANASSGVWSRALSGALGSAISNHYNTLSWGVTDTFGPGWVTYRVQGRVSFWWLELSPAIGRDTSLPLRYESRFSVNKVGVKYRQDLWTLQLLHRF
jgi:hypothetical protein